VGITKTYIHMTILLLLNFLLKNIKASIPVASPIRKKVIIRFIFSGGTLKYLLISSRIGLDSIIKNEKRNIDR